MMGWLNGYRNLFVLEEDSLPVTEEVDSKRICDKFVESGNTEMLTGYFRTVPVQQ